MKNRRVWLGAIGIAALIFLSLVVAPNQASVRHGSTYSRAPSGYGAWYAYMQQQGTDVQRWQKPLEELVQPDQEPENLLDRKAVPILDRHSAITLLQIDNGEGEINLPSPQWIEQGNVVIQLGSTRIGQDLGLELPVTRSPFTSILSSSAGGIKIETSRRLTGLEHLQPRLKQSVSSRLADSYGIVVLEQRLGQGKIVTAITPYLAANAYQDEPGNFKFLEQLVTELGYPIWVDEYLHGYKDQDVIAQETSRSLFSYLADTPILLVVVQAIVVLLVLIWGLNQRLGPPIALENPKPDNSTAYIQALAAVLRKANCSEFVVETIAKAEQLQLQRSLGLGNEPLESDTVIAAWVQQTRQSDTDLRDVLTGNHRSMNEQELLAWLGKLRSVRQHIP